MNFDPSMRIVLDPGHGGNDPGAIGRKPAAARESDLVAAVCVGVLLELFEYGHDVRCTRPMGRWDDRYPLSVRTHEANEWPADRFVSVHFNSFGDRAANGIEILHFGSEQGIAFAKDVLASFVDEGLMENGLFRNRGLRERTNLAVLRDTHMPSILVELPFLSNPEDLERSLDVSMLARFARAIAKGVDDNAQTSEGDNL